jgi:uncharacterized membrane protein
MIGRAFQWLFSEPWQTYLQGKLVFTSRIPGEVRLLLFVLAAAAVWYLYRRAGSRLPRRRRNLLLGLRLALVTILFLLLGAPALRVQQPRADATFTAIIVDNSASMMLPDVRTPAGAISRLDAARQVVFGSGADKGMLEPLRDSSQVLIYAFADSATRIDRGDGLTGHGGVTNLFASLRDVDTALQAVPLSAAVLLTDGCRNAGGGIDEAAKLLRARGVPAFIMGLGDPQPPDDLEVVQVLVPARVRRNSDVELDVTVRHTGFNQPFELRLKRGDALQLSRKVEPSKDSDLSRVRITFAPDHSGTGVYTLEIPAAPSEKYPQNNSRDFTMVIEDDRLPVLYIEGSPRQEYRFLRRALFRDPDFRLVGVLRLAPDRFFLQGSNETENYLLTGFPTTSEQLFRYQAIILGDIEAAVFSREQMALIEEFVKTRGGGLLMLGGVNSFGLGRYAGTPVARMLPLSISASDAAYSDAEYRAKPVEAQLSHPVMKISLDSLENASIWGAAPPLVGITPVQGVKPGATVLLTREGTGEPVLAVQNYGAGRVAALTSGGSWFWRMSLPAKDEFQEKFWKQLVRWLVVGVKEQLSVSTDAEIYARRDPVTLRATVLGKDLVPLNDARVLAAVTDPLGNVQEVPMDWILSEEGVYHGRYVPEQDGAYRLSVRVEGWESKPVEKGFLVNPPVRELADAGMKRDALVQMARDTNGGYFDFGQQAEMLSALRKHVRTASAEAAAPKDHPLWDMPALFIAALALMGTEWFLRRRSGLT